MSYVEFKGTLCSSVITGGYKDFFIQPSPTGYYSYTATIKTYKCKSATCKYGFKYSIHITIYGPAPYWNRVAYENTLRVDFDPTREITTQVIDYVNLEPGKWYRMVWETYPVDRAGECWAWWGCILCADIDMLLWQAQASPTPTVTPPPTYSPTPPPTYSPPPTYPPTSPPPTYPPTSPPPTYPPTSPPPWSPSPTPTITPPPYSPTPTPTVTPPPTAALPWYFWALLGAAFGLGIGLIVVEASKQRK